MKKLTIFVVGIIVIWIPPLQLLATQSPSDIFKQQLLEEIKREITDLNDQEIMEIIDQVEQNIDEYIEHYEETPTEELLTKDEKTLQNALSTTEYTANFSPFLLGENKPMEQLILEEKNPRLKQYPTGSYYYDEVAGEIKFNVKKDTVFGTASKQMLQSNHGWLALEKGDVLVNFDNGSSGLHWGHVGMMYNRTNNPNTSTTIEILGFGDKVKFVNYNEAWHRDTTSKMAYTYVPAVYGTDKPAAAADNATQYLGKGYSLWPILGNLSALYCTELVFMAYLSQGVNLGNGMNKGSFGILFPKSMYCDDDLQHYYIQNSQGGIC